jgi:hypothetical protein
VRFRLLAHQAFRAAARRAHLGVVTLAFLVAACGPGVGGTGTGGDATTAAPVAAASVCEADFAALLACPAGAAAAQGSALAYAADSEPASRHLARFEGSAIDLELRCVPQRFVGTWGNAPGLGARFYGELRSQTGTVPASLLAQRDGPALRLELRDDKDASIGTAITLRPVAAPTSPAPC